MSPSPDAAHPPWAAASEITRAEAELRRIRYFRAAEFSAALRTIQEYYEPLARLGQAVLDEHRSAILAEQALQDPERQADARANAAYVQELLQEMLAE